MTVLFPACKHHQRTLYQTINKLLRVYWKQLGRKSHNYADFALIRNGAKVFLFPSKVIFRNGVYSTEVPADAAASEQLWVVLRCDGPELRAVYRLSHAA